ncbi:MAG: transglycosylase domain-containing protein [Patescibacteria group bacterium]|jgi:membrane peptidoglycan carboxypeptidase
MPIPYLKKITYRDRMNRLANSPEQREKKPWNKKRVWKTLGFVAVFGFLACIIIVIGAFAWISRDLPDPNKIKDRAVAQSTKIFARDGATLLYDVHGDIKRTLIKLSDIPLTAQQATISLEDQEFYKHGGISLKGLIRSVLVDIFSGSKSQGGSTITQQFVKNSILTTEKKFTRKIKEIVLAYEIEKKFKKDEILQLYFNEIPYGSNIYGIEAASQTFFDKPAKELSLSEGALLAAITQRPTYLSPYGNHTDALIARQQYGLKQMYEQGYITKTELDGALAVDILKRIKPKREQMRAPHFVMMVKEQLADRYGEAVLEKGGLKVVTTLDWDKQEVAEKTITDLVAKNEKKYNAENAAMVAIDPKTGQVLSLVGSRDYFDTAHDGNVNVAIRERNPGSSFKPVVYATAFNQGYSPDTMIFDLITNFGGSPAYIPKDYDGGERGPVTMRKALAGSLNIPAVKTLYLAGIPNVIDMARKLGYTTLTEPDRYGLALALGAGGAKLIEHTNAFATFAANGTHRPIATIMKVEDKNGKILEQFKDQPEEVISKDVVASLLSVLTDNEARSFIFGSRSPLVLPDRTVFAKTGTTNDWRDGWAIGGTPSLVAGFWAGNNDYSPMAKGADGVFVAAPGWNQYLKQVLKGTKREGYPKPPENKADKPVLQGKLTADTPVVIDRVTGKKIPDACKATYPTAFVAEVLVKEVHEILQYVQKENPNGPAPENPSADPQYTRWETPVQKWAKSKGYTATSPDLGDCNLRDPGAMPTVSIVSPTLNQTVNATPMAVSAATNGPRPINKIIYSVDDKVLGESNIGPGYSANLDLTGFESGFHTLAAQVIDNVENSGTSSLTFNYLIQ